MASEQPQEDPPTADVAMGETALSSAEQAAPLPGSSTDDIRRQVEQEHALADTQRRLLDTQAELETLKKEKRALETEKQASTGSTDQLRTQLSALQSSFHKSSSELSVLQIRIEVAEKEKRELLEETERLQQRLGRNTQDLYTLRSQKADASQKIAHLDVEVSELKMAAESAKFNEQRGVQALQGARAEILNLNKALSDVEERFGKYRAEKQAESSRLELEHTGVVARLTSLENNYNALQRTYNDQSRRLAEAHANIANLTAAAAEKKASTSMELQRLMEENRLLEKRGDDARAVIADREAELERLSQQTDEQEREWSERCKKEERLRREAEKRTADLKVVVERLALAGGEGTDVSPTALLASEIRQSGKSYTQFFTDYTIQEQKLREKEEEVARLEAVLTEVTQEIAERKPILDDQKLEHDRAIERSTALAAELSSTMSTRDAYEGKVKSLQASAAYHAEEVGSLQATIDDLSRQVQGLTRQIAIRDDPALASITLDGSAVVTESGDIVTDHLLEFRSIRSLQEQNQKLLKLTRGLMAKLEQHEIQRTTADQEDLDTGTSLDQAAETIKKLHSQLLDAQKKILDATRERDFFSKLLARGEGLKWSGSNGISTGGPLEDGLAPHEETISTLQAEIDIVKARAESDVAEVRLQLRTKTEEVGIVEIEKTRAQAKATLLEEQLRMLQEASNLQKQEVSSLDSQLRQLSASVAQATTERRAALEEVATRQAEADRLRTEAANMRAEKDLWQSTEARLQADFRTVQSERTKLQQLIDNLNNVSAENERSRVEERVGLERRIEDLQREATGLRTQIEQAREATRAAEAQIADFDARLAAATTAVRGEKDAAEAELSTLKAELEKVKQESENRYRIGINWKRRTDTLTEERKGLQAEMESKDKEITEIKERLASLNGELENTKTKLAETEKKLADAQRANELKDGTVQRLQTELSAKAAPPPAAGQDVAALNAVKAERDQLQQKLSQVEKDLEAAKTSAATTTADLPVTTGTVDGENKDLQAKVESLQKDIEAADQRYDLNVTKVNRVNMTLKSRITELENQIASANTRIAELEKELTDLRANPPASAPESTGQGQNVEEAVKAAVAAREAELQAEHTKALQEAQGGQTVGAAAAPETVQAAVAAKEAELNASFDTRVNEAVSSKVAESEAALKTQIEELQAKVKTLERQLRTGEIARKTMERQKTEAEAKLKKLEGGDAADVPGSPAPSTPGPSIALAAAVPANAAGLSPAASEFKPSAETAAGSTVAPAAAAPSTSGNAASSSSAPIRGASVRGRAVRARGGAPGRANAVLSAVNATLASAAESAPGGAAGVTSPTGGKRPLPEDGEIADSGNTGTGSTSTEGTPDILQRIQGGLGGTGRQIKRPRGTTGRGRGTLRRPSGQGGQGGQAGAGAGSSDAPPASGGDGGAAGGAGGQPPAS